MSKILSTILNHKSIRKFKEKEVSEKIINNCMQAISRTPTAMGLQQYSVIRVVSEGKKNALAEISGQDYIAKMPEIFFFMVDFYRNDRILAEKRGTIGAYSLDMFLKAYQDSILAAQTLNITVEAQGLGGVFLASILKDMRALIELFELPKYCFPTLAYGFGHPDEKPSLKPRLPQDILISADTYNIKSSYLDELEEFDIEMSKYYDFRDKSKALPPFTLQVANAIPFLSSQRQEAFEILKEQGFNI